MRYREVLSLCDPDVLRRVIGRFDLPWSVAYRTVMSSGDYGS
jgi:hypothetical protein